MTTTKELSMKLLIEAKSQKVCFAETGSDVVEFLTGLLSLPLGTVASLLTKDRMVGSIGIGNVLGSTEKLDANYRSGGEVHLSPAVAPATLSHLQKLLGLGVQLGNGNSNNSSSGITYLYTCGTDMCRDYFSAASGGVCPGCSRRMNTCRGQVLVRPKVSAATRTMAVAQATYTVMDDLSMSVTPAASNYMVSSIALLARCGVKDVSTLQEKTVKIGKKEALGILAASLTSKKTVLTDVFLPRKKKARCKRDQAPEEVVIQI